jgi:hypothetical protein
MLSYGKTIPVEQAKKLGLLEHGMKQDADGTLRAKTPADNPTNEDRRKVKPSGVLDLLRRDKADKDNKAELTIKLRPTSFPSGCHIASISFNDQQPEEVVLSDARFRGIVAALTEELGDS